MVHGLIEKGAKSEEATSLNSPPVDRQSRCFFCGKQKQNLYRLPFGLRITCSDCSPDDFDD